MASNYYEQKITEYVKELRKRNIVEIDPDYKEDVEEIKRRCQTHGIRLTIKEYTNKIVLRRK